MCKIVIEFIREKYVTLLKAAGSFLKNRKKEISPSETHQNAC